MNITNEEAPMPGEWEVVEREDGAEDVVPCWNKENLPAEEPSENDPKPEIDPTYQYCFKASLLPYFERLSSTTKPSRRDIIYDKNAFLREEGKNYGDQEPLIVMNNNCVVRTTKAGLEKSLEDRAREDREFESNFRGRGRGRGGSRGRGGRGRGEGGFSRRGYEEIGNPNEVKLGDRRQSSSSRQRSRSPLLLQRGRQDSKQDCWARPRSPPRQSSGRRDSSRDSYGGKDIRDRRESFGGHDRRESFDGNQRENHDRRNSSVGSYENDRRGSYGGSFDDRRGSFNERSSDDRRGSFGVRSSDDRDDYDQGRSRDRYSSGGSGYQGRHRDDSFSRGRNDSFSHDRSSDNVFGDSGSSYDRGEPERPGPKSQVFKVTQSPSSAASSYAEWKRMKAMSSGGGKGV